MAWKVRVGELLIVHGRQKFTERDTQDGLTVCCHAWKVTVKDRCHRGVIWQIISVNTAISLTAWLLLILLLPNEAYKQHSTDSPVHRRSLWRPRYSHDVCEERYDSISCAFSGPCFYRGWLELLDSLLHLRFRFTHIGRWSWASEWIGQQRWRKDRQLLFKIRRNHRAIGESCT